MIMMLSMLTFAFGDIDLNEATKKQLAGLNGVDLEMAAQIVELREERGQISNIESLRILNLSEETLEVLRKETSISMQVSVGGKKKFTSADAVLEEFSHEPDVRSVQAMAMSYSRTNPEVTARWLAASKRAYALPKVNVQYEKELDEANRYDYVVGTDGDLVSERDYAQVENDDKMVVRMEWRLDKLVMSSEQIRVINESKMYWTR